MDHTFWWWNTFSSSISWFVRTPYFGISEPTNKVSSVTSLFDPTIFPINNEFPLVCWFVVDLVLITVCEFSWYDRFVLVWIFLTIARSLFVPIWIVDGGADRLLDSVPFSLLSSAFEKKGKEILKWIKSSWKR